MIARYQTPGDTAQIGGYLDKRKQKGLKMVQAKQFKNIL